MIIIKYIILFLVFCISFYMGNLISKKYSLRLAELKDIKNALNIIESKIKFTYEPLSDIFLQTSNMVFQNISQIFVQASNNMKIEKAKIEEQKNAKMYKTLGAIVGLAFVIILI